MGMSQRRRTVENWLNGWDYESHLIVVQASVRRHVYAQAFLCHAALDVELMDVNADLTVVLFYIGTLSTLSASLLTL
jgi:hypothetical protein